MREYIRHHARSSIAAVFVISFLLIFLLMDRTLNVFDEGLVLVDAMRTLHGDLIHRDFYSPYGPGSYYILAWLFSLDPHWFILSRIYGVATMAGVVASVFGLLIGRTRLGIAFAVAALCGLWMLATPFYLYPVFPSLLLALLGSMVLLRWFEHGKSAHLLLAGATAGATALFRYDAGFFLAAAHFGAVAAGTYILARPGDRPLLTIVRAGMVYAAGAGIVFLPFAVSYLMTAPVDGFIADIIDYPLHHYAAMRGLPFPDPGDLARNPGEFGVYLPVLIVLLATIELARMRGGAAPRSSPEGDDRQFLFLVVFVLLTAVFYYKGIIRVSSLHMMMAIVPSLLVLGVLVDRWWANRPLGRALAALLVAAMLVPPAYAARGLRGAWKDTRTPLGELLTQTGLARGEAVEGAQCPGSAATMMARQAPDYHRAAAFLRRFSRPEEKIFVALDRHDRIFVNPVALYFMAQRQPGTHWHQFDPGLQTREDIQREMIADLQAHHVRWVVRDSSFEDVSEPNQSRVSSGVHTLDRYLASRYRPVAASGKVEIWLARDAAPPQQPFWPDCLAPSP